MNKRKFVKQRSIAWRRFEALLDRLDTISLRRFKPAETAEFSRLFREICYDLALIRSRDWGRRLVGYLNDLVSRGHNAFHNSPPGRLANFVRFLTTGFPVLFRRNIRYFITAASIFFGTLFISWGVVQHNPELAKRVVSAEQLEQFEWMYDDKTWKAMESKEDRKSIQGAIGSADQRSFMVGVYTLIENGIAIGTIAGYLIAKGHSDRFLSFVVGHGSFELTAIAVAGGAGLMLGTALLHPGQRRRLDSLKVRGLEAVQIAGGAAVMLFIAAMVEGFWSPTIGLPNAVKYIVGGLLWVLVIGYLSLAGRWESNR